MVPPRARITITADKEAPSVARRFVEEFCAGLPSEFAFDVKLLASELVTNSATHCDATAWIALELSESTIGMHVAVIDSGDGFDHTRVPAADSIGGWGLRLVAEVADNWGVETAPGRTTVWFELGLEAWPPNRPAEHVTQARVK
jgi:anti-sigma regulatory factor (Ser/Thr protein kinase)